MRAIAIRQPGGPEVLELVERPLPTPSAGEVRVRVRATAVNRADTLQRMGLYPAPPGESKDVPGLEYAGEIDALGEGVAETTDLKLGDRVFGLVGGGAYAEAIVTHARALARMPSHLSFEEAAACPEAFITAYDAMVVQGGLRGGETALIHAVGSGVGTAAVQLVRALGGRSIGTARTQDKLDRCKALGLDHGLLVTDGKFAERVKQTPPAVILDLVGGAYVEEDARAIALKGRIVVVGLTAGASANVPLGMLLQRRATIIGTVIRARPLEEKIATLRTFEREVVPLLERKAVRPVIDDVLPLADAARAHERMGKNETFGKLVLRVA